MEGQAHTLTQGIYTGTCTCVFLELSTCTCTIVVICEGTMEIKSWGLLIHKVERAITQCSKSRLVEMAGSMAICNILLLYHQNNNKIIANLSVSYNSNRHVKCSTKIFIDGEVYMYMYMFPHTMSRLRRAAGCLETDSPLLPLPLPMATQRPREPAQLRPPPEQLPVG